jgi:hypothetical protein
MYNISLPFVCLLGIALISTCKDKANDPVKNEENELITKVHLHLVNANDTTKMAHAEWVDLSPDDPAGRTIDTLVLDTATQYLGEIELFDESKNPVINISKEVEKEKDDHLFIYRQDPLESSIRFSVEISDKDSRNLPVGLKFKVNTKNLTGTTKLNVILKHQPGTKNGSAEPGDADLDVWIPVKIR